MNTTPATAPHIPTRRSRARAGRRSRLALAGALAVLVLLCAGADARARSAATLFTVTGKGWGHGIGMSQYGAYGYAKHGWKYKAILKHYYSGIAFGSVPNDPIRVRLRAGLTSVKLTCAKPYAAAAGGVRLDIDAGVIATVTWVNGKYKVSADGRSKRFTGPVAFTPSAGSLRLLTPTDLGNTGLYRGVIRVLHPGDKFMVVNRLPLESYLRGVVPHEVSPSWPAEALKAQACAARAYAQRSRNAGATFDVYCTVRDQVYKGVGVEAASTNAAVRATAGVVPTYGGKVITAFYFSTSGGRTENIENSWQTAAIPYLKGVNDPYDTYSPRHAWTPAQHSAGALAKKLGGSLDGSLRAIYVVKRGVSPRIVKAAVIGSRGVQFLHGSVLRSKLGLWDSWAYFRSMSINPAAADKVTVAPGTSIELRGRLYQAAPKGAAVKLHYYSGGVWRSRNITTTRGSENLGDGHTAKYSAYAVTVKPAQTTKYYFSYGKARSPQTTITISAPAKGNPAVKTTPAGASTPSPAPSPAP